MTLYCYKAYGLRFSTDKPFDILPLLPHDFLQFDIQFWFAQPAPFDVDSAEWLPHPSYVRHIPKPGGAPPTLYLTSADGQYIQIRYPEGVVFTMDAAGTQVWASSSADFTFEYLASYALGSVLSFLLAVRQQVFLHASAVVIRDQAVLFCAPSGYGKSTTASYFGSHGHPVLSDDISLLEQRGSQIFVTPAYPHLRLWDTDFLKTGVVTQTVAPDWDKQYLRFDQNQSFVFAEESVPLGAIYLMREQAPTFQIERLNPGQALMRLMDNTFMAPIAPPDLRKIEFDLFSRLVHHVPVSKLKRPEGLDRLHELYQLVLADRTPFSSTIPPTHTHA